MCVATELLTEWAVITASLAMCLVYKVWWTCCCVETEHELERMLLTQNMTLLCVSVCMTLLCTAYSCFRLVLTRFIGNPDFCI